MDDFFAFATESDIVAFLEEEEKEKNIEVLHEEEVDENDRSNWADVVDKIIFKK